MEFAPPDQSPARASALDPDPTVEDRIETTGPAGPQASPPSEPQGDLPRRRCCRSASRTAAVPFERRRTQASTRRLSLAQGTYNPVYPRVPELQVRPLRETM